MDVVMADAKKKSSLPEEPKPKKSTWDDVGRPVVDRLVTAVAPVASPAIKKGIDFLEGVFEESVSPLPDKFRGKATPGPYTPDRAEGEGAVKSFGRDVARVGRWEEERRKEEERALGGIDPKRIAEVREWLTTKYGDGGEGREHLNPAFADDIVALAKSGQPKLAKEALSDWERLKGRQGWAAPHFLTGGDPKEIERIQDEDLAVAHEEMMRSPRYARMWHPDYPGLLPEEVKLRSDAMASGYWKLKSELKDLEKSVESPAFAHLPANMIRGLINEKKGEIERIEQSFPYFEPEYDPIIGGRVPPATALERVTAQGASILAGPIVAPYEWAAQLGRRVFGEEDAPLENLEGAAADVLPAWTSEASRIIRGGISGATGRALADLKVQTVRDIAGLARVMSERVGSSAIGAMYPELDVGSKGSFLKQAAKEAPLLYAVASSPFTFLGAAYEKASPYHVLAGIDNLVGSDHVSAEAALEMAGFTNAAREVRKSRRSWESISAKKLAGATAQNFIDLAAFFAMGAPEMAMDTMTYWGDKNLSTEHKAHATAALASNFIDIMGEHVAAAMSVDPEKVKEGLLFMYLDALWGWGSTAAGVRRVGRFAEDLATNRGLRLEYINTPASKQDRLLLEKSNQYEAEALDKAESAVRLIDDAASTAKGIGREVELTRTDFGADLKALRGLIDAIKSDANAIKKGFYLPSKSLEVGAKVDDVLRIEGIPREIRKKIRDIAKDVDGDVAKLRSIYSLKARGDFDAPTSRVGEINKGLEAKLADLESTVATAEKAWGGPSGAVKARSELRAERNRVKSRRGRLKRDNPIRVLSDRIDAMSRRMKRSPKSWDKGVEIVEGSELATYEGIYNLLKDAGLPGLSPLAKMMDDLGVKGSSSDNLKLLQLTIDKLEEMRPGVMNSLRQIIRRRKTYDRHGTLWPQSLDDAHKQQYESLSKAGKKMEESTPPGAWAGGKSDEASVSKYLRLKESIRAWERERDALASLPGRRKKSPAWYAKRIAHVDKMIARRRAAVEQLKRTSVEISAFSEKFEKGASIKEYLKIKKGMDDVVSSQLLSDMDRVVDMMSEVSRLRSKIIKADGLAALGRADLLKAERHMSKARLNELNAEIAKVTGAIASARSGRLLRDYIEANVDYATKGTDVVRIHDAIKKIEGPVHAYNVATTAAEVQAKAASLRPGIVRPVANQSKILEAIYKSSRVADGVASAMDNFVNLTNPLPGWVNLGQEALKSLIYRRTLEATPKGGLAARWRVLFMKPSDIVPEYLAMEKVAARASSDIEFAAHRIFQNMNVKDMPTVYEATRFAESSEMQRLFIRDVNPKHGEPMFSLRPGVQPTEALITKLKVMNDNAADIVYLSRSLWDLDSAKRLLDKGIITDSYYGKLERDLRERGPGTEFYEALKKEGRDTIRGLMAETHKSEAWVTESNQWIPAQKAAEATSFLTRFRNWRRTIASNMRGMSPTEAAAYINGISDGALGSIDGFMANIHNQLGPAPDGTSRTVPLHIRMQPDGMNQTWVSPTTGGKIEHNGMQTKVPDELLHPHEEGSTWGQLYLNAKAKAEGRENVYDPVTYPYARLEPDMAHMVMNALPDVAYKAETGAIFDDMFAAGDKIKYSADPVKMDAIRSVYGEQLGWVELTSGSSGIELAKGKWEALKWNTRFDSSTGILWGRRAPAWVSGKLPKGMDASRPFTERILAIDNSNKRYGEARGMLDADIAYTTVYGDKFSQAYSGVSGLLTNVFKKTKTVYSIGTHVTNMISWPFAVAPAAGLFIWDPRNWGVMSKAAKDFAAGTPSKELQDMVKNGLFGEMSGTANSADLVAARRKYGSSMMDVFGVRDHARTHQKALEGIREMAHQFNFSANTGLPPGLLGKSADVIEKAVKYIDRTAGQVYTASDNFWRYAIALKRKHIDGWSTADAVMAGRKAAHLENVPHAAKIYRRKWWSEPFFMFDLTAAGNLLDSLSSHPFLARMAISMQSMMNRANYAQSMDLDSRDMVRDVLLGDQHRSKVPLFEVSPFADRAFRDIVPQSNVYLDIGKYLPMFRRVVNLSADGGFDVVKALALGTSPVLQELMQWTADFDTFRGKIDPKGVMTPEQKDKLKWEMTLSRWLPMLTPGVLFGKPLGYYDQKILKALTEEAEYYGKEPPDVFLAVLGGVLGLLTRTYSYESAREHVARKEMWNVSQLKTAYKRELLGLSEAINGSNKAWGADQAEVASYGMVHFKRNSIKNKLSALNAYRHQLALLSGEDVFDIQDSVPELELRDHVPQEIKGIVGNGNLRDMMRELGMDARLPKHVLKEGRERVEAYNKAFTKPDPRDVRHGSLREFEAENDYQTPPNRFNAALESMRLED
tara:strand:- start:1883 stop:8917 length:7035 start_codon:yes stop_codon:yes gene_type:complete